jgi:hypothetical protein
LKLGPDHSGLLAIVALATIAVTLPSQSTQANGLDAPPDARSLFIYCTMYYRENRTMHETLMLTHCSVAMSSMAKKQKWSPLAYSKGTFGWNWTLCPSRYHDYNLENLPDIFVRYWLRPGVGALEFIDPASAAEEAVLGHFPECFWTSDA